MTTTPYEARLAKLRRLMVTDSWTVGLGYELNGLLLNREGYLARAAEEDAVKQALLAVCKELSAYLGNEITRGLWDQEEGERHLASLNAAIALALAEKEA